ncbi:MAG: chloride channel protein, partial [Wenzhouxiangellaceae bacterium]|nr:chloride channel protein [Wenzhouxiangellaceae bacterium]
LVRASYWNASTGIACGVAAAISATFNAPIAGILFVHEVVLRHFALSSFAPVASASIVAYLIADALAVREPLLLVENAMVEHYWEYALFVLIGAVGALLAVVYMRGILQVESLASRLRIPLAARPAAAGLLIGITALWIPEILGVGHDTLRAAIIDGRFTIDTLGILFIAKLAASVLCLGMGFAGGVFGPALVSGALYGVLCGSLTIALIGEPHANLTVYGICGMVALASPVIGAPLASVLIVFELTHNYTATLAALASVAIANLIAYRFFGRSLFDVQLGGKGLDLSTGRSKARLSGVTLHGLISDEYLAVDRKHSIDRVLRDMSLGGYTEACVLDHADGTARFAGIVTLADAYRTRLDDDRAVAGDAMREDWPVLNAETTVWQAMDYLRTFTGQVVPVVESADHPRLLGVVTEQALVSAYLETMERVRREEHGTQN